MQGYLNRSTKATTALCNNSTQKGRVLRSSGDAVDEEQADVDEGQLLLELLAWGGYYDVPEIVAECEIRLWRFVTCDNVCNMVQGAHLYM